MQLPFGGYYFLTKNGEEQFKEMFFNIAYDEQNQPYFYISQIELKFLYKLIDNGYLNKVVFLPNSLLETRTAWMQMVRNLVYIQFNVEVKREVDRLFMQQGFEREKINSEALQKLYTDSQDAISEFQKMLLYDSFSIIDFDKEIQEKEEKKALLEKFLKNIDDTHWYYFYFVLETEQKINVIQELSEKLIKLLYIVNIADYLALLMMELSQNAEKSHYEYLFNKYQLAPSITIDEFLKNKENRLKIKEILEKNKEYLKVSIGWEVASNFQKMRVAIINKTNISENLENTIKNKMQKNSKQSIADFFQENEGKLGGGLGLFYVAYIKEECEKQGLVFDAFVETYEEKQEIEVYFEFIL